MVDRKVISDGKKTNQKISILILLAQDLGSIIQVRFLSLQTTACSIDSQQLFLVTNRYKEYHHSVQFTFGSGESFELTT